MEDIKIFDTKFFGTLTDTEKSIYLAHRNSMLIIFPTDEKTKTYDDEILELVEKSSKVFVSGLPDHVRNPPPVVPPTV